jgi:hypothetical protein
MTPGDGHAKLRREGERLIPTIGAATVGYPQLHRDLDLGQGGTTTKQRLRRDTGSARFCWSPEKADQRGGRVGGKLHKGRSARSRCGFRVTPADNAGRADCARLRAIRRNAQSRTRYVLRITICVLVRLRLGVEVAARARAGGRMCSPPAIATSERNTGGLGHGRRAAPRPRSVRVRPRTTSDELAAPACPPSAKRSKP